MPKIEKESENERVYVLKQDFNPASLNDWEILEQRVAYYEDQLTDGTTDYCRARDEGNRRFLKTRKFRNKDGETDEQHENLSKTYFNTAFDKSDIILSKTRYVKKTDDETCMVDFLRRDDGTIYFVKADIEMPTGIGRKKPIHIPEEIVGSILYAVPRGQSGFSIKALIDQDHAKKVYMFSLIKSMQSPFQP